MIRQLRIGSAPSAQGRSLVEKIQDLRRRVWIREGAGQDISGADDLDLAPDTVHFYREAGGRILAAARVTLHHSATWRPDPRRFGPMPIPNRVRRIAVMSHLVVAPEVEGRGWSASLDRVRITWARRHAHMVLIDAPRQRVNRLLRERFQVVQMHASGPAPFEWRPTTWAALSRVFLRRWVVRSLTGFGFAAGLLASVLVVLAAWRGNVVPLAAILVAAVLVASIGRRSPWLVVALAITGVVGWDRSLLVALALSVAVIEILHWVSPKGRDSNEEFQSDAGAAATAGIGEAQP
jgi:hypothetical protein